MKIPENIIKKFEDIEKQKKAQRNAARRAKRQEKKIADGLKKMKEERMPELIAAAEVIAKWVSEFYESAEILKFFSEPRSLRIFCKSYWMGLPAPGCEMTTFATISLDSKGRMTYCERYKWMPEHETFLDVYPINPMVLIEALHPDYLVALALHVSTNAVWDYIHDQF